MKRNIIKIDTDKCNGCEQCIPNCPEGAIQIIDGKARLISDLFCDGLGACLGHCPEGAITIEERDAEPYDENKVMQNIVIQGENTIAAHLQHLREHGEDELLRQAVEFLREKDIPIPLQKNSSHSGCPGSKNQTFKILQETTAKSLPSRLSHWPIQMHLISPDAPQYRNTDLLLAADCVAYSIGNFHGNYLSGKSLAIACPKLDENQDVYLQKLIALIDQAQVNTITVMMMQVPCCSGLLRLVQQALQSASRKVPLKAIVVGLRGEILREEWL